MNRSIPGLPGVRIRRSLVKGVRYIVADKVKKRVEEEDFARTIIGKLVSRVQTAEFKGSDRLDVMVVKGFPKKGAELVDHTTAAQIVADHIRAQGAEVIFEDRRNLETGFDARVLSMQWRRAA